MRPATARVCVYLAYAAVLLSIVPLVRPVLLPDFLVGHDAAAHHTYAFVFNRALTQGQVPVRWVEGAADGLGQPLFNHYQVGFYYLVALLHWTGPDLSIALKLMVAIAWAGGAVFMFLLCRPLGSLPAALAAAVFVWSPYLLVDVYVRSAYPEMTAIALAPGVLWSVDGVLRTGRRRFVCSLALTSALLLISHLPTALIIAPLITAFVAGSWVVLHRPPPRIRLVIVGGLLGAGMSAFYVLPAILQLDAINISRITTGNFDYHRHFVQPEWWFDMSWGYAGTGEGAGDQMSLQLGIAQWTVLAAAAALLLIPRLRRRHPVPGVVVAGWLLVVVVSLFMMTARSAFVWEAIGPMAFLQFPWRLLMVPAIACGVLAAILLSGIRNPAAQAVLVVCAVAFQWHQTGPYRELASTRERAAVAIDDPAWLATGSARKGAFREAAYDPISVRSETEPARGRWTVAGAADISPVSVTDASMDVAITAPQAVTLAINSPFFPGWRVTVDGRAVAPSIDGASGYMTIEVPAGSHRVTAAFGRDGLRTIAELITLLSALSLVAMMPVAGRMILKENLLAEKIRRPGVLTRPGGEPADDPPVDDVRPEVRCSGAPPVGRRHRPIA